MTRKQEARKIFNLLLTDNADNWELAFAVSRDVKVANMVLSLINKFFWNSGKYLTYDGLYGIEEPVLFVSSNFFIHGKYNHYFKIPDQKKELKYVFKRIMQLGFRFDRFYTTIDNNSKYFHFRFKHNNLLNIKKISISIGQT